MAITLKQKMIKSVALVRLIKTDLDALFIRIHWDDGEFTIDPTDSENAESDFKRTIRRLEIAYAEKTRLLS